MSRSPPTAPRPSTTRPVSTCRPGDGHRPRARNDGRVTEQIPVHELNDGTTLPAIGFGTYPLKGKECVDGVLSALEAGYRLIDTAVNYGNEEEVGEAVRTLRRSPRRDHRDHQDPRPPSRVRRRDRAASSGRSSGSGLDYLDLHLIHWPNPSVGKYAEAWRALVDAARAGAGPLDRRLQLHRGAPRADHRRDRRDAGGQPDRAAPVLPPGADARRPRAAGHPHRVVEPAGQAAGAVRRAAGGRRRRAATACPPAR